MAKERIVAVGLLTQREVELLGHGFSRLWPVDNTPCFQDLLQAIDDADTELSKVQDQKVPSEPVPGGGRY